MLKDFFYLLLPNYCLLCHNLLLNQEKQICMQCFYLLPHTTYHLEEANEIDEKFYGKVEVKHATSMYKFYKKSYVQILLHHFKYKGNGKLGEILGLYYGVILKEKSKFYQALDLIIPVPLHYAKLKKRGYNQSTFFAKGIAKSMAIPYKEKILARNINTDTQTKKSDLKRWKNIFTAFAFHKEAKIAHEVRNKKILLVDDIITTGATLESCAKLLLYAGANSIYIATMATAE